MLLVNGMVKLPVVLRCTAKFTTAISTTAKFTTAMLLIIVVDGGLVEVIVGIVRVRVHVIGVGRRRSRRAARRAPRRRRGSARLCPRRASTLAAAIATTLRRADRAAVGRALSGCWVAGARRTGVPRCLRNADQEKCDSTICMTTGKVSPAVYSSGTSTSSDSPLGDLMPTGVPGVTPSGTVTMT